METLKQSLDSRNLIVNVLALIWTLFGAGYIVAVTFMYVPKENVRIVDTVTGFLLGTVLATILNYFFGSSKSSADKTEIIKQQAENIAP